jgi:hypothetical protein
MSETNNKRSLLLEEFGDSKKSKGAIRSRFPKIFVTNVVSVVIPAVQPAHEPVLQLILPELLVAAQQNNNDDENNGFRTPDRPITVDPNITYAPRRPLNSLI